MTKLDRNHETIRQQARQIEAKEARTEYNNPARQARRDLNSELRHRTWSVYAQGGLSWATGVWYRNLDAKRSYRQSAAAGGGFDLTIRPWVRVGAEYIWSRYRREQRPSTPAACP